LEFEKTAEYGIQHGVKIKKPRLLQDGYDLLNAFLSYWRL
jgi:hypothetical protein